MQLKRTTVAQESTVAGGDAGLLEECKHTMRLLLSRHLVEGVWWAKTIFPPFPLRLESVIP